MSRAEILSRMLPDERTAALVTSPISLRYLCGFPAENALALISKEQSLLFVPEKNLENARSQTSDFKVSALKNGQQLLDILIKYGIKHILVEADKMTVSEWRLFKEQLHYAELSDTEELSEWIMGMRTIKSSEELDAIKRAQKICDKAYEKLLGSVRKGLSERQIASLIDFYLAEAGSEGQPFPTVVLSGKNTAGTRGRPTDRKITDGDLVVIEFGSQINGYCAKMCRTTAVGSVDEKVDEAYRAVSCAISDGVKVLRPGIGGKVADSVAKSTLNAWGYDKYAVGGLANGIGLEPMEAPYLGSRSSAQLRAGTALAVSCEIRIPGRFGIKIGDMAALTEDGCTVFTSTARTLVHI